MSRLSFRMALARVAVLGMIFISPALGDVIDFENLPTTYMYLGGDENIGSYYAGVTFGSTVTGLDLTGSAAFPPHSGSTVAWDPVDASVTISFAISQTLVGLWYTSLDPMTLAAFDGTGGAGTLLGSKVGTANTDGTTGSSDFLSVSAVGISSVTLRGIPGDFIFDDVTLTSGTPANVREPSSFVLVALVLIFFWFYLRRCRRTVVVS